MRTGENEQFLLENKDGEKKLVEVPRTFLSYEAAREWVEKKYTGYRLIGIQEGIFGDAVRL